MKNIPYFKIPCGLAAGSLNGFRADLSKIRFGTDAVYFVIPAPDKGIRGQAPAGIHSLKKMDSRLLPAGMTAIKTFVFFKNWIF